MSEATYYRDATAVTARALETTGADFANGMNAGAACAPGLGIGIGVTDLADGPDGEGAREQFTLLDQSENVRVPQDGQQIGGLAYVDRSSIDWASSGGIEGKGVQPILTATAQTNSAKVGNPALDGVPVVTGDANLQTLAAGWVNTAI